MIDLVSSFEGYQWVKWYNGSLVLFGSLFAVLLGAGGVFAPSGVFTLALPASRRRQLLARAGLGLGELLVIVMLPSLSVALVAPVIGESVSYAIAAVHGLLAFTAGSLIFGFTLFFATVFSDTWRPMLLGIAFVGANLLLETFLYDQLPYGVIHTMSGASFFSAGLIPWTGLAICTAGALALIWAAVFNLERRDF
jgi:ABC-type transport system involved in multi-copper enzyme maturation permease subunit